MIRAVFLLLAVNLTGCSAIFGDTFSDRAQGYLDSETQDRMQPVAGQAELPIQDTYVIPDVTLSSASAIQLDEDGDFVVPSPQPLVIAAEEDSASLTELQGVSLNPRLERDGAGTQVLRLNGHFAFAWTSVAEALVASDYALTDLNRSTGTYYITIFDPTAERPEKSFWQWLTNSNELGAEVDYLLRMNRSRLGVYLSLQKDLETLADDALAVSFLTDLQELLVK
ncbi:MAG: outer membrane protein assembly factor BamC [Oleispira antarctica]|uniref:Putative lipoprotein n=1 Tax=Oleispira antarctica RB-8 TaxID=698738 RepID=R4YNP0_OLEAN|nr:outer membrane protein assembly factor BamC [Oleispira antarctica]MBQ0791993.1 outer membrane protein assembly factor BamC [Oleispira antarctica]CCK76701.1 putative lipoprotein [Oleispira antarctica RB-8]|tara:strand:- start:1624 stop:2298 length:675 start_codon:yes stop_codon:yes gene_type:complete